MINITIVYLWTASARYPLSQYLQCCLDEQYFE